MKGHKGARDQSGTRAVRGARAQWCKGKSM